MERKTSFFNWNRVEDLWSMQHTRLHLKYPGVPPPPAPSTTGFAVYAARLQRIFFKSLLTPTPQQVRLANNVLKLCSVPSPTHFSPFRYCTFQHKVLVCKAKRTEYK